MATLSDFNSHTTRQISTEYVYFYGSLVNLKMGLLKQLFDYDTKCLSSLPSKVPKRAVWDPCQEFTTGSVTDRTGGVASNQSKYPAFSNIPFFIFCSERALM